jgi:hypothetical protein
MVLTDHDPDDRRLQDFVIDSSRNWAASAAPPRLQLDFRRGLIAFSTTQGHVMQRDSIIPDSNTRDFVANLWLSPYPSPGSLILGLGLSHPLQRGFPFWQQGSTSGHL